MRQTVLIVILALAGCTTNSYIRSDGTEVTVKKFLGIPYLEEDVKTTIEPMGSSRNPL